MIAALLVAIVLGAIATYSLVGSSALGRGYPESFMLGFGMLALSGAGFSAITLPWAVGMAVAVAAALVLAPIILTTPRAPFAAAVTMTVGLVMAAGIVRWLVPIASDLSGLNAWFLALAVIAAAAVWAVGGRATWLRTAFWICVAAALLLLVGGVALGAPNALAAPLISADVTPAAGIGWLVVLVVFGMLHPAPPRSAPGIASLALALLFGLVGLLSLLGGIIVFPNTGLLTLAGYANIGTGVAGAILATLIVVVTVVALGVTMRMTLAPWHRFEVPFAILERPGVRITIVAALVGLLSFAPVPSALLVTLTAAFGVVALIVDWSASRKRVPVVTVSDPG